MVAPSWYKPTAAIVVNENQEIIQPQADAPSWYKEKNAVKAPDWYDAKKQRPTYESVAMDALSTGTKYLISKAASDKSIPKGVFDDAALGIGKIQGWCGEYASRLSTASKVGDSWNQKIANANKTPDAKNSIQPGYKVVIPLGVNKKGEGYGHVIAAITAPDEKGNFYVAQSNADGRQNRGEGPGVATYGIFNVNDLNKRYGKNWGALPGELKTNAFANGKGAIPIQKPQNDTGEEDNWVNRLIKGGVKVVSSAVSGGPAPQKSNLTNDQAPSSVLNTNNPKVLADYVLKQGISDLQSKEWWVNSPVKNEAWKILNDTRGIDTSKYNPDIVKSEIGADNANWLLDPVKKAMGMKTAKQSVHTLTQAEADQMGKPDILTGALYKGAGNEKGFQPAIQEKRMVAFTEQEYQKLRDEAPKMISDTLAPVKQVIKNSAGLNPAYSYLGGAMIDALEESAHAVASGISDITGVKKGDSFAQIVGQLGNGGLKIAFAPAMAQFNSVLNAIPGAKEISSNVLNHIVEGAIKGGEIWTDQLEKLSGVKGFSKEAQKILKPALENTIPILIFHAAGKLGVKVVEGVADKFSKGESASLRDTVSKPFDPQSVEALKPLGNGKTALDNMAAQRARLSELQQKGKQEQVVVPVNGEKALEINTFTYSDGKVGASLRIKTEEHSIMTPITGKYESPRAAVEAMVSKIEELTNKGSDIASEAIRQKIDQLKETNFKDIQTPKDMQEGVVKPQETTKNIVPKEQMSLEDFRAKSNPDKNFKQPKIVEGTGKEKTRSLAVGVEQKAIEHRLTSEFGDLPTYKEVNMGDQARRSQDIHAKDPALAFEIAMGRKPAPKDVLPESVFVAVENAAIKAGDVETLRQLATNSKLVSEATLMGQRIRALGERDPESPVAAISSVIRARENVILKKLKKGETAETAKRKAVSEIKVEIVKVRPTKQTWANFIESIKC